MNKPSLNDKEPPINDPTKYNGPNGATPPGSGVPHSEEEELAMLASAREAERQESERAKARSELAALGQEWIAAKAANKTERVEALERQRKALAIEIKRRFGY